MASDAEIESDPAFWPRAVAAVITRDDGRTLMVRRAAPRPAAGYWTPVTGRPRPGESLKAAVAREVREEVGLEVTVGDEVHRCPTEGAPFLLVWFAARPAHAAHPDALLLQREEVSEARWVLAAEAARLAPMFRATRAFYEALAARHGG